jgi:hypothetical protein
LRAASRFASFHASCVKAMPGRSSHSRRTSFSSLAASGSAAAGPLKLMSTARTRVRVPGSTWKASAQGSRSRSSVKLTSAE